MFALRFTKLACKCKHRYSWGVWSVGHEPSVDGAKWKVKSSVGITIHCEREMNTCSKFHCKQEKTSQKCPPHGGGSAKIRWSFRSLRFIIWGLRISVQHFMAIQKPFLDECDDTSLTKKYIQTCNVMWHRDTDMTGLKVTHTNSPPPTYGFPPPELLKNHVRPWYQLLLHLLD